MMITRSEGPQGLDISALHAFHATARDNIQRALGVIRKYLDMDVAFISEFIGDWRYMHYVDSQRAGAPISVGDQILLQEGYCGKIVEGFLPELIVDTSKLPEAMAIPETQSVPVGAHMSVPLWLANGDLFGTFCCFNFTARPELRISDLETMRAIANEVAKQIDDNDYEWNPEALGSILRKNKKL